MPAFTLAYLFDRYFKGIATPEEKAALMELLSQDGNEGEVRRLMEEAWVQFQSERPVFDDEKSRQILQNVLAAPEASSGVAREVAREMTRKETPEVELSGGLQEKGRSFNIYFITRVAAVVLLVVAGVFYFRTRHSGSRVAVAAGRGDSSHFVRDIAPGMDGAILTLADGRKIVLDSAANGELLVQGSTRIVKQGGRLAYMQQGNAGMAPGGVSREVLYNTMNIPRGRQYQLILPDGSHVWLNAASSIRYPASFSGKERKVEITGEAYFEVAKNVARPFRVKIGEEEVEVLGTHFNIMAYDEEATVKTTLLEGAVKVIRSNASHLLKPGQQAQLNKDGGGITVIDNAPLDETIAWKNGQFFFSSNRVSLPAIMRQIARWYDVKVLYEGEIPELEFGGKISRNSNISEVLKIIELSSKVHFRIEDKTIIVMP
jgi:transmembrane sensor